jgi:hypothetical protein
MKFEDAFTPAMQKKVEAAVQVALKEVKPRPAVERVLTVLATGNWTHYAQLLGELRDKRGRASERMDAGW